MGRVQVDTRALEGLAFDHLVGRLREVGEEAIALARRETPVLTGFARRSLFWVVLDERGNVIAGDTHDGNGEPIPSYIPAHANGRLRVFVGANAPYYIWIEIGARGRAGKQILARTAELIQARADQLSSEMRRQ